MYIFHPPLQGYITWDTIAIYIIQAMVHGQYILSWQ